MHWMLSGGTKMRVKIRYYEGRIDAINDALGEFQEYKNNIDKEKE